MNFYIKVYTNHNNLCQTKIISNTIQFATNKIRQLYAVPACTIFVELNLNLYYIEQKISQKDSLL